MKAGLEISQAATVRAARLTTTRPRRAMRGENKARRVYLRETCSGGQCWAPFQRALNGRIGKPTLRGGREPRPGGALGAHRCLVAAVRALQSAGDEAVATFEH